LHDDDDDGREEESAGCVDDACGSNRKCHAGASGRAGPATVAMDDGHVSLAPPPLDESRFETCEDVVVVVVDDDDDDVEDIEDVVKDLEFDDDKEEAEDDLVDFVRRCIVVVGAASQVPLFFLVHLCLFACRKRIILD
jgi:hypothetical protein